MLGPSGSFLKMSLLDPSWTKNEPLNPHTQEAHRPIGGPFSGKKSDQPKDQIIIHHLALCGVVPLAPSGPPACGCNLVFNIKTYYFHYNNAGNSVVLLLRLLIRCVTAGHFDTADCLNSDSRQSG